jgi:hypothetical protein
MRGETANNVFMKGIDCSLVAVVKLKFFLQGVFVTCVLVTLNFPNTLSQFRQ